MVCALRAIQTKSLDNMLMYHTGRTLLNSTVQLALILGMSIDANEIISEYDSLTVKSRDEIKINGSRLMSLGLVKPGPIIGKLLNAIELNIVNKALMNNEDSIIEFTKKIFERVSYLQTLRTEKLTKTYGEKTLFKDLDFIINEHDRIGLIGTNGSGKTSLLNVISGADHDSTGNIITSKTYTIGYLKQDPELDEKLTVLDAVFAGSQDIFNTIRRYEQMLDKYSANPGDSKIERQYLDAEAKMNEENAWTAESDVKTILTQLKIDNMHQKVSTLSGGQKRRVGLAQVLIQSPDLLILDEPTNHLDFDSIYWLQDHLAKYKGALLLVTHDRYFLDEVVNNIWELSFGKLYKYVGNYQDYVSQKADRVDREKESEHKKKSTV